MGWERRKTKKPHTCNRPDRFALGRRGAEAGDIWRCRRCGARWELTYPGVPAANIMGPMVEPQWIELGSPEDIWRDAPPRQTGTDWLKTAPD